jgi:homoserine kinase
VDVIIEPVRAILIPGFGQVKAAAVEAGALGCSISGSGPSMFALSSDADTAAQVGEVMQRKFAGLNIDSEIYISGINRVGPVVLD